MAAKVLLEEVQYISDEFWWRFNIHASCVDELAKDVQFPQEDANGFNAGCNCLFRCGTRLYMSSSTKK